MTDAIALYTDGGVIAANPSQLGGTWAYCLVDASGQRIMERSGLLLPTEYLPIISSNVTELLAMVEGLTALPIDWRGTVYSDSLITLLRVFHAGRLNGVPAWLVDRLQTIQRSGKLRHMRHQLVRGHPSRKALERGHASCGTPVSIHNVWCDAECKRQKEAYFATV